MPLMAILADALDFPGNPFRLGAVAGGLEAGDLPSIGIFREQRFREPVVIVGDDRVGGIQDRRRGPVVAFQLDNPRIREIPVEGHDVVVIRAPPGIDALE